MENLRNERQVLLLHQGLLAACSGMSSPLDPEGAVSCIAALVSSRALTILRATLAVSERSLVTQISLSIWISSY